MKRSIVVIVLFGVIAAAGPARAQTAASFSIALTLPTFPCSSAPCDIEGGGSATGLIDGLLANGATLTLSGVFDDPTCLTGNAEGTGSFSGGGLVTPIAFEWVWERVGPALFVTIITDGGAGIVGQAVVRTIPALPSACLPGGDPGPADWVVNGVLEGV